MKDNKIFWIIFAIAAVFLLAFSGIFKTAGATTATLSVSATNTSIVVKDNFNNVISNDAGALVVGDTYKVEIVENPSYDLKVFVVNGINELSNIENNQITFVCTGNVNITAVSVLNTENGGSENSQEIKSVKFSTCYESNFGIKGSIVTDIVLQIKDSNKMALAELRLGETYDYLVVGEKYYIDAYSVESTYNKVYFTTNLSFLNQTFPKAFVIKSDILLHVKVTNAGYSSPIECIKSSTNEPVTDFIEGEEYTIIDNQTDGNKVIFYIDSVGVSLPYTFTYVDGMTFDYELEKITGVYMTLIGTNDAEDTTPYVGIVFNPTTNTTTYFDWRIIDTCTFFVDLSEYIGCQLSFDLNLDYLPIAISVNGSPVLSDFAYLTITEDLHTEIELGWSGVRPSPPALVG